NSGGLRVQHQEGTSWVRESLPAGSAASNSLFFCLPGSCRSGGSQDLSLLGRAAVVCKSGSDSLPESLALLLHPELAGSDLVVQQRVVLRLFLEGLLLSPLACAGELLYRA